MDVFWGHSVVIIYPLVYFLSLHCTHVAFVNCLLKKLDDDDDDVGCLREAEDALTVTAYLKRSRRVALRCVARPHARSRPAFHYRRRRRTS